MTEKRDTVRKPRPFLGILFRCCRVYGRIYRTPDAVEYRGGCPKCGQRVTVAIGPGGSSRRLFEAG